MISKHSNVRSICIGFFLVRVRGSLPTGDYLSKPMKITYGRRRSSRIEVPRVSILLDNSVTSIRIRSKPVTTNEQSMPRTTTTLIIIMVNIMSTRSSMECPMCPPQVHVGGCSFRFFAKITWFFYVEMYGETSTSSTGTETSLETSSNDRLVFFFLQRETMALLQHLRCIYWLPPVFGWIRHRLADRRPILVMFRSVCSAWCYRTRPSVPLISLISAYVCREVCRNLLSFHRF